MDAGLSLADVAGSAMSKQAVHLFETGRARPTLLTLRVIIERLGNISLESALADDSEHQLIELDEQRRYRELGVLAGRLLENLNTTKRTRAMATFYVARSVLDNLPDRAVRLFRSARRQLLKNGEPALAAEAMDWEAAALYLIQDVRAMEVGRQALERYRGLAEREPRVEARMLEHLGTYQLQRGEHTGAIARYHEALEVAGSRLELTRLAKIYHGMAEGCRQAGETRRALEYMERAVHFYRTEHDVRGAADVNLARAENDYGVHLMRAGRLACAEEMIRAALDHYAECGAEAGLTHALLSMGELCHVQGRTIEAVTWTVKAVEHAERLSETVALASGYQQLGELWAVEGNMDGFEACYDRAFDILERSSLPQRCAECAARRERVLQAVGPARQSAS